MDISLNNEHGDVEHLNYSVDCSCSFMLYSSNFCQMECWLSSENHAFLIGYRRLDCTTIYFNTGLHWIVLLSISTQDCIGLYYYLFQHRIALDCTTIYFNTGLHWIVLLSISTQDCIGLYYYLFQHRIALDCTTIYFNTGLHWIVLLSISTQDCIGLYYYLFQHRIALDCTAKFTLLKLNFFLLDFLHNFLKFTIPHLQFLQIQQYNLFLLLEILVSSLILIFLFLIISHTFRNPASLIFVICDVFVIL